MLESVKEWLRLTTNAFDGQLNILINAACLDLGIAGVTNTSTTDPAVIVAIATYCEMHFGSPDQYDRLKASYDEQKAQLSMASDYTDYSMIEE